MCVSLLFFGNTGVGISSIIQHIINKHPYTPKIIAQEGNPPNFSSGWYKEYCFALQRCKAWDCYEILQNPDRGFLSCAFYNLVNCSIECGKILSEKDLAAYFENTTNEGDKKLWKQGNFDYRKYPPWKKVLNLVETLHISSIVVVVDSSREKEKELELFKDTIQKLHELVSNDVINGNGIIPTILVLAHKQDLVNCLSVNEIREKLELDKECYKNLNWAILPTSIKNPESIKVAMDWVLAYSNKFDSTTTYDTGVRCGCVMI